MKVPFPQAGSNTMSSDRIWFFWLFLPMMMVVENFRYQEIKVKMIAYLPLFCLRQLLRRGNNLIQEEYIFEVSARLSCRFVL